MEEDREDFADQLGRYLGRMGFTQQELAYRIGMHRNTVVKWMNRTLWPSSRGQVLRLADELSLTKQERKDFLQAAGFFPDRWPAEVWTVPHGRDMFFTGRDDQAGSLNNLAELYREQRRYEEAEPLYQRSIAIWEKTVGPEDPCMAQGLNNLALVYSLQGKYGEAELLHFRALQIREQAFGSEHPVVAQSRANLAILYSVQGRYREAEPFVAQALPILARTTVGDCHGSRASHPQRPYRPGLGLCSGGSFPLPMIAPSKCGRGKPVIMCSRFLLMSHCKIVPSILMESIWWLAVIRFFLRLSM